MTLRYTYDGLGEVFEKEMRRRHEPVARAATRAIKDGADQFKTEARGVMLAAGFSKRFAFALRVKTFPKSGDSIDAAIYAYSKVPYAGVFEDGAVIRGKPYMWVPLPSVPMGRGGRRIKPGEYRRKIGHPLYSLRRPGKPPMLFANIRTTGNRANNAVSIRQLRRGHNPGGRGKVVAVPLYIGVPVVKIKKKFDTTGVAERVQARLPGLYFKHFTDD